VDVGLTKINHNNASGYGDAATLYIPLKPRYLLKNNRTALSISDNLQITYNEKAVSLYFTSDSVLIAQDKTGIQNFNNKAISNLNIYPNPFQTMTTIEYNLNKTSKIQIALFDITGKQITLFRNESQLPGNYQIEINAEKYHLNPGIYMLKFLLDDGYVSKSIVKF